MPESMTGFGAARRHAEGVDVRAELRSVNHRHLDLRFKLPSELSALQPTLRNLVKARVARGHVEVRVHVSREAGAQPEVQVDLPLARALYGAVQRLAGDLAIGELGSQPADALALVLGQPGVVGLARPEEQLERVSPLVEQAVSEAADALVAQRLSEGEALAVDLRARIAELRRIHGELSGLSGAVVAEQRQRLEERVAAALEAAGHQLDPARLAHEVVLLSDKSDVTEELVRLDGHLSAALGALDEARPGKRLGFLVQEILREFNTVGSKSASLEVTRRVVTAKVEVEKIREQVLNLA